MNHVSEARFSSHLPMGNTHRKSDSAPEAQTRISSLAGDGLPLVECGPDCSETEFRIFNHRPPPTSSRQSEYQESIKKRELRAHP